MPESKEWQTEWPAEEGAWWFFGRLPKETDKALVVVIVKKTADEQPKYFAFWTGQFWFEGDVVGKWLKIEVPKLPED